MKKHPLALIGTLFFLLAGLLQLAARTISGFAEWYAITIYPCIVKIYGGFCNLLPISIVEFGIYILTISAILYIGLHIRQWKKIIEGVVAFLGFIAFLFTVNCGINYYRRPFSSYLDLEIRNSSVEELKELCAYLVDHINETADDFGQPSLTSQFALARQGCHAASGHRISPAVRLLPTSKTSPGLLDTGCAAIVRYLFPFYSGSQL